MKKLMIAFAVVAAAALSQAAMVDWSFNSKNTIKKYSGADGASITVYLLDTAGSGYAATVAGLANGSVTSANIASQGSYLTSGVTGASGAKVGKASGQATVASPGADYSLVFVYFDSAASKDYYYLSSAATGKSYDGSAEYPTGTTAIWMSSDYNTANWHEVASAPTPPPTPGVPEPTSGLLMLLGMAGLALRRKRA